jgi:hypothetical protein
MILAADFSVKIPTLAAKTNLAVVILKRRDKDFSTLLVVAAV